MADDNINWYPKVTRGHVQITWNNGEELFSVEEHIWRAVELKILERIKRYQFNDTSELEKFHIQRLLNRLSLGS
jgi:hypothetical protein